MGKHIVIAGNYASGKTTLTKALYERTGFVPFWEQPEKRPFQGRFTTNLGRWSLANQIDFFTFRAQQEIAIRLNPAICIQDGSLDQDMFVFTKHLVNRGVLDVLEYDLCRQVYNTYRALLPSPDLIVNVKASVAMIMERRAARARASDEQLVKQDEIEDLESLVTEWITNIQDVPIIEFNANDTNFPCPHQVNSLIQQIEVYLAQ